MSVSDEGRLASFTERRFALPLVLATSLFFVWAIGVNLNDILIPHFKKAFRLSDFQSSFIQVAFFGGYFLAALPAGWVMRRLGYRGGILVGLLICAAGAFLFIPASMIGAYGFFLLALFVLACGQCFLEVGANPYVTTLGPPETGAWRLNTAQAFNSVGAVITPIIGATFILSGIEQTDAELAALDASALAAYQSMEAGMVRGPYLVIMGIFLFMAFVFWRAKMPEVEEERGTSPSDDATHVTARDTPLGLTAILGQRHLVRGVVAQFCYVGAQVGVASFVIRFVQHTMPDTPEKAAARYLMYHLLGFMIGRFVGAGAMRSIPAPRLLAAFAGGAILAGGLAVTASGTTAVWMIVLLGFFHSIMFPTIFALSLSRLGALTKVGSSLLVMSIVGGAVLPAVMGYISDLRTIQTAFIVPLLCYLYVLYFALRGHRPQPVTP